MKYYPCLWAKGWQYKCVILVSLFKIQNQFTRKMVEIKNVFPNELWKFKWKRYWESKPIVSPVAFSDDQAAGRDQAWPSVWKGLYPQPGGKFQWENRCLQFGFQVLRTRRGCQRDLLNGDSPCSETFILIAGLFFQLTISDVPGVWKNSILTSICCTYLLFPHSGCVFLF